jgi:glycine C-acetyltransferase
MFEAARAQYESQVREFREAGIYKSERILAGPQKPHVSLLDKRSVLNLCANNYLGFADHPEVAAAAHAALDRWGYGLSSVRFIFGTQEIHKQLERRLSEFLATSSR